MRGENARRGLETTTRSDQIAIGNKAPMELINRSAGSWRSLIDCKVQGLRAVQQGRVIGPTFGMSPLRRDRTYSLRKIGEQVSGDGRPIKLMVR